MLRVPVGTEILEEDNETLVADLSQAGDRVRLAKGGNGGFGNIHLRARSTRRPASPCPARRGRSVGCGCG